MQGLDTTGYVLCSNEVIRPGVLPTHHTAHGVEEAMALALAAGRGRPRRGIAKSDGDRAGSRLRAPLFRAWAVGLLQHPCRQQQQRLCCWRGRNGSGSPEVVAGLPSKWPAERCPKGRPQCAGAVVIGNAGGQGRRDGALAGLAQKECGALFYGQERPMTFPHSSSPTSRIHREAHPRATPRTRALSRLTTEASIAACHLA